VEWGASDYLHSAADATVIQSRFAKIWNGLPFWHQFLPVFLKMGIK